MVQMANPTIYPERYLEQDSQMWSSLQRAIATSSGFKRWQLQQKLEEDRNLELQVRRYLQETLKTLAY